MAHVRGIHQHLVGVVLVLVLVVLRHGGMVTAVMPMVPPSRFRQAGSMAQRPTVVGGQVVSVLLMALIGRVRLLHRVVDIVVPHSVVARQRACYAWVPPEQIALAGRRTL